MDENRDREEEEEEEEEGMGMRGAEEVMLRIVSTLSERKRESDESLSKRLSRRVSHFVRPDRPDSIRRELQDGWRIILATFLQLAMAFQIHPNNATLFGAKYREFELSEIEKSTIPAAFIVTNNIFALMVPPLVRVGGHRLVSPLYSYYIVLELEQTLSVRLAGLRQLFLVGSSPRV